MTSPIRKLATLSAAAFAFSAFGAAGTLGSALLGNAPAAVAQDAQQQPPSAGDMQRGRQAFAKVLMSLGLNDAQKARIRDLRAQAEKANEGVTDRAQRRANMQKFRSEIETVFTPAQAREFKAKMAELRKQWHSQQGANQGNH